MNRKQFASLLFAVAIVGGAGLLLLKRNQQSWSAREVHVGDRIFANFRYNDVAAIHVKGDGPDFNIERKDGLWRVRERGDYPANYSQIKDLLLRMRDIKVVQSDTLGPSQWGRVGLEDPAGSVNGIDNPHISHTSTNAIGTLLEFKDGHGNVLNSMLVGKRHLRPPSQSDPFRVKGLFDGCYIRLPADPSNVLLISDELAAVAPDPQSWLNRNFIKMENIKSVSLTSSNGANLWTLLREAESSPWSLSDSKPGDGEQLNTAAVSQIVEALPFLEFVDVLSGTNQLAKGLEKPLIVFIETFDHFFYTLKIGAPVPEGAYPMSVVVATDSSADLEKYHDKLAKEKALMSRLYLLDATTVQPLLRSRADLLQKNTTVARDAADR